MVSRAPSTLPTGAVASLQTLGEGDAPWGPRVPLGPPSIPGVSKPVILGLPCLQQWGRRVRIVKIPPPPTMSHHYLAALVGYGEGGKRLRIQV